MHRKISTALNRSCSQEVIASVGISHCTTACVLLRRTIHVAILHDVSHYFAFSISPFTKKSFDSAAAFDANILDAYINKIFRTVIHANKEIA